MDIERILAEATVEEKAALIAGTDFMYTNPLPRFGVRTIAMADGPHGVRKQAEGGDNGATGSAPATCFPTAATLASSWNVDNISRVGAAIARECRHYGVDIILAPGVNIKRNPLCGRNFEYFSEDPLLSGVLGGAFVDGAQGEGVGVSVKHFAANNSENYRFVGDSLVDGRALREIYLRAFERIVRNHRPYTLMCAYNKLNGEFCSQNDWLLNKVLRSEWGFDGAVMSDWGAVKNRVRGVAAGLDLEMPGDSDYCRSTVIDAANSGKLKESELDAAARNILTLVDRCGGTKSGELQIEQHNDLAAEVAADCAVLMKNDGTLPLDSKASCVVIGELFDRMRYQGAGSSMVNPTALTTPMNAFDAAGIEYRYAAGYNVNGAPSDALIEEAVNVARDASVVLIFAGLTDYYESESFDRKSYLLPDNQIKLIEALHALGKKTVLVLFGGAPFQIPHVDSFNAILNMYLAGQGCGTAVQKLLFGEVNPSGKLAETWHADYSDVPFGDEFGKSSREIYRESIFVGYRYYDAADKTPAFCFGHGLSYTTFEYLSADLSQEDGTVSVRVAVRNSGNRDGAEIVQLYVVNNDNSKTYKAPKELRAFGKLPLAAGESGEITLKFALADLAYYNDVLQKWVLENGNYTVAIGSSSRQIWLTVPLAVGGNVEVDTNCPAEIRAFYGNPSAFTANNEVAQLIHGDFALAQQPVLPLTIESRIIDFRRTFMGRIIRWVIQGNARKLRRQARKAPRGVERDNMLKGALFLAEIIDSSCLRSISMAAGRQAPYNLAEALVEFANLHFIRGFRKLRHKYPVPPIAKE